MMDLHDAGRRPVLTVAGNEQTGESPAKERRPNFVGSTFWRSSWLDGWIPRSEFGFYGSRLRHPRCRRKDY
jgi:hypothetical protein